MPLKRDLSRQIKLLVDVLNFVVIKLAMLSLKESFYMSTAPGRVSTGGGTCSRHFMKRNCFDLLHYPIVDIYLHTTILSMYVHDYIFLRVYFFKYLFKFTIARHVILLPLSAIESWTSWNRIDYLMNTTFIPINH